MLDCESRKGTYYSIAVYGMNEWIDGLVDPAFVIQQLPRVPYIVDYHKQSTRRGDGKAL